ncbi:hypothetical protein CROQUDRAFT_651278 [Cronartium quercuum f. sp. fusiforme G11]|uniref:Uncharacterized protein n=1 Tax=Cronartium quercuum f. sp. fusiforme G11 TaxID=708437 RepID=A0A9P6NTN8_9BASI|nr:hypothetical protein CROQUDRAFT_651278 [Cronartium quercuum f. sp. fusiforme G11]
MFKSKLKKLSRTNEKTIRQTPSKATTLCSPPVLQPINIVNLNRSVSKDSTEHINLKAEDGTKSGVNRQQGAQNLVTRLKKRRTSKAVTVLTKILLTLGPVDRPSRPTKDTDPTTTSLAQVVKVSPPSPATLKKTFKTVTGKLANPKQANKIIALLKTQSDPLSTQVSMPNVHISVRGVCLLTTDDAIVPQTPPDSQSNTANKAEGVFSSRLQPSNQIVNLVTGLSVGTVLSAIAETSGLFDALAACTAGMIEGTVAHRNLIGIVPTDRISLWNYWWGFEIALPPPSIAHLEKVQSVSSTFLQLLIALTVAGGIVEILPFIKYLSSFLDMEWKAIVSQNQGRGVVMAATWVLPLAVVPRSWDFDPAPV